MRVNDHFARLDLDTHMFIDDNVKAVCQELYERRERMALPSTEPVLVDETKEQRYLRCLHIHAERAAKFEIENQELRREKERLQQQIENLKKEIRSAVDAVFPLR